ncbi:MAG: SPOR domain-containing protein [Chitinispirillales bacterium]|jgi:hypothetical protein|nr:SPOR domain-containing protein [Chitinispirillales bacterium]
MRLGRTSALLRTRALFTARAQRLLAPASAPALRAPPSGVAAKLAAIAAALFAAALSAAPAQVADADAEAAAEALKKGNAPEAKALLEQAVKRAPSDCNAALSYALTLPPKEALKKADSLSRAKNAPDWARARSLRLLGDNSFFMEDYKNAAEAYRQASTLDDAPIYRFLHALSIAMAGQTESARGIWIAMAGDTASEMSGEAARLLALLPKPPEPKAEAPVQAPASAIPPVAAATPPVPTPSTAQPTAPTPSTSPKVSPPPPTPVPAAPPPPPAKADDAKKLPAPVASSSQQPKAAVSPPPPPLPMPVPAAPPPPAKADDAKQLPGPVASGNQQAAAAASTPPAPTPPIFTVQVGAFSSKDNADNLVKRLAGKYKDITVSTTVSGDQTLYRVRVGAFQKREEAVAYADDLIIEAGLSARVVER